MGADSNDAFEKEILRDLGLPEDYVPATEEEACRLVIQWMEES